jgi:hypothetical protein
LLHAIVHPADIQDRDGGILVMATLFGMFPFLKTLFADSGYQGPKFAKALAKVLPNLDIEIVKRSDPASGFGIDTGVALGVINCSSFHPLTRLRSGAARSMRQGLAAS